MSIKHPGNSGFFVDESVCVGCGRSMHLFHLVSDTITIGIETNAIEGDGLRGIFAGLDTLPRVFVQKKKKMV